MSRKPEAVPKGQEIDGKEEKKMEEKEVIKASKFVLSCCLLTHEQLWEESSATNKPPDIILPSRQQQHEQEQEQQQKQTAAAAAADSTWSTILLYDAMSLSEECRQLRELALSVEAKAQRMLRRVTANTHQGTAATNEANGGRLNKAEATPKAGSLLKVARG